MSACGSEADKHSDPYLQHIDLVMALCDSSHESLAAADWHDIATIHDRAELMFTQVYMCHHGQVIWQATPT